MWPYGALRQQPAASNMRWLAKHNQMLATRNHAAKAVLAQHFDRPEQPLHIYMLKVTFVRLGRANIGFAVATLSSHDATTANRFASELCRVSLVVTDV